jgi:hypothetical protein
LKRIQSQSIQIIGRAFSALCFFFAFINHSSRRFKIICQKVRATKVLNYFPITEKEMCFEPRFGVETFKVLNFIIQNRERNSVYGNISSLNHCISLTIGINCDYNKFPN